LSSVTAALRLPDPDDLPPPYVDTRLVRPETREELLDGRRIEAFPPTPSTATSTPCSTGSSARSCGRPAARLFAMRSSRPM